MIACVFMFLGGVNFWQFSAMQLLVVGGMAVLLWSSPYRRARLSSFLNPWEDPFNKGFQLTQSLIAIGRGEFDGVGGTEAVLRKEHDEAVAAVEAASAELAAHESAVAQLSERAERAQQSWFALSALAERVSATVRIASDRAQLLETDSAATASTARATTSSRRSSTP